MIIQANTSELLCIKCGEIHTLIGSVFEDSQFYNQEGNRYKHGSYDPNRHCKFWIDRIQAKENTIIEESVLEKIKNCIKKDKIENIKNKDELSGIKIFLKIYNCAISSYREVDNNLIYLIRLRARHLPCPISLIILHCHTKDFYLVKNDSRSYLQDKYRRLIFRHLIQMKY